MTPRDIIAAALATIYGNVFLQGQWNEDSHAILAAITARGWKICAWDDTPADGPLVPINPAHGRVRGWIPVEETP